MPVTHDEAIALASLYGAKLEHGMIGFYYICEGDGVRSVGATPEVAAIFWLIDSSKIDPVTREHIVREHAKS